MTDVTAKKIVKWLWIFVTAPFGLLLVMLLLVWAFAEIPSLKELEHPDSKQSTQIIADGGEVLTTFHLENRTYIDYEDISPYMVQAAVATEDVRFYKHSGIDFKGLGRVLVKTLALRNSSQGGGSTITQQLAKTLYPREDMRSRIPGWSKVRMVWTKLKEWITAVKIERNYTKDEIVGMYLNSVFFGAGAYGVETAALTFFSKKPSELTIEESATLVGMINKPTRYNPVINPDLSLGRRNFVMGQMAKAGFVDRQDLDSLLALPIELHYQFLDHNAGVAPYFRDMLRRDMNAEKPRRGDYGCREDFLADSIRWENDGLYGWLTKNRKAGGSRYNLDKDGLRIYTTINYKMQVFAEQAVAEHLGKTLQKDFQRDLRSKRNAPFSNDVGENVRNVLMGQARRWSERYRMKRESGMSEEEILRTFSEKTKMRVFSWKPEGYVDTVMTPDDSIKYYKSILRAAMMAMEPNTGHVKAYVGGPSYKYFKYDNVSQGKRQIGSTVKPFIYSLAVTEGLSPCDRVSNVPQTFELPSGELWTPRNENNGGELTLKNGLATSNNNISAFLMRQFGPEAVAAHMRRMGVSGHIDEVYSLCVGSTDVSVKDMVAAYNTFPSKGVYVSPVYVTRIEDAHGNVLSEFSPRTQEVLGEDATCKIVDMMRAVVDYGTGSRLHYRYGLTGQMAGKTGTTNDNSDGWFIGYTPTICAGVWVGAEDRQIHFQSTALGQGANMALPIWGIFMKKCVQDGTVGISPEDVFSFSPGSGYDSGCADGGRYLGGDEFGAGEEVKEPAHNENYYFN